jgi:hypothetical protein
MEKVLIFTRNRPTMKWIKLTALSSILFIAFTSCERTGEEKKTTEFSKNGIILNYANETPATPQTPTNALGTMDITYSKETRTLSYTVNWSGLSGPVTAMHIHGTATPGYVAGIIQNIITSSNGIFAPGAAFGVTGKVTATLLADGVVVKESDILNGFYYINIHTALNPNGEIRGQIVFQ